MVSYVDPSNSSDNIRPFEWLTSAESLKHLFDEHMPPTTTTKRALHVGCGSSTVGEYLVEELGYNQVVNIDMDGPTLEKMKQRWQQKHTKDDKRLEFCRLDLVQDEIPYPAGHFDVVIDKSTLDCTLCSDEATAALLCQVYRSLNAEHGVYIVISFHHVNLLFPLLRDCPEADWAVSHQVMRREVEDVIGNGTMNSRTPQEQGTKESTLTPRNDDSAWASGSFQPTEGYRTTVNVMICQRKGGDSGIVLDRNEVRHHVYTTNDIWFQSTNPMLTRTRHNDLKSAFGNETLDIQTCYTVMFTEAEREHLTFEHFMEDFDAFLETRPNVKRDCMSFETAVSFLEEMQ
jgi:hypothetical protein